MNRASARHRNAEPERLTRAEVRRRQNRRLRRLLSEISSANAFWARKFEESGTDVSLIRSVDDLPRLPTSNKAELVADQAEHPPHGSNLTFPPGEYSRMHQTSGTTGKPLRWLDTPADWDWFMQCWAQIFRMVGLRKEDRLAFPFSFGPFVGFWAAFEGACRLGNLCLAGGGMSSEARLQMMHGNAATVVCCTPTYALRLAEVAEQEHIDLAGGPVRALIVAGEPGGSIPATRARIEAAWGARVFDHWGMTEIGALAVECVENPGGMHVLETECIAEIVDSATLEPVGDGKIGELLITNLGRIGTPLVRYRTGDLVQRDTAACPCGRQLLRLKGGILGRSDEMFTIRGNNVFPSSLEAIVREFDEVAEFRIAIVTRREMQHLQLEFELKNERATGEEILEVMDGLGRAIKERLNFEAEVIAVPAHSLPRSDLKSRRFHRSKT